MQKFALASAAALAAVVSAAPAHAENFSFQGTLTDPNQVLLFNFSVGTASTVTLRTYSYAGGTNAQGQVIAGGNFDPILALFDSTGALIGQNDDGGSNVPAASDTGRQYDTFLQTSLAAGTYTVSVMAYSNFAVGPNLSNGFQNTGSFDNRGQNWAFDVLNVGAAAGPGEQTGAVPEPAAWALMIGGFGMVGGAMRRRRTTTRVSFA